MRDRALEVVDIAGDHDGSLSTAVRLIPVEVAVPSMAGPTHLEMSVGNIQLRIEVGTRVSYVGELVRELRARC